MAQAAGPAGPKKPNVSALLSRSIQGELVDWRTRKDALGRATGVPGASGLLYETAVHAPGT